MKHLILGVLSALVLAASPGSAATLSIAGDRDCFGLGGVCPEGSLFRDELGGAFFADNSTPGDADFTDDWDAFPAPSFNLSFSGGTNTSIQMLAAGIADNRGPWSVLLNGTNIGSISTNTAQNAFQMVRFFNFTVDSTLLLPNNVLTFMTDGGDGYIIDHVALVGSNVPEPAAWTFMLSGFGIVGYAMRRRRSSAVAA